MEEIAQARYKLLEKETLELSKEYERKVNYYYKIQKQQTDLVNKLSALRKLDFDLLDQLQQPNHGFHLYKVCFQINNEASELELINNWEKMPHERQMYWHSLQRNVLSKLLVPTMEQATLNNNEKPVKMKKTMGKSAKAAKVKKSSPQKQAVGVDLSARKLGRPKGSRNRKKQSKPDNTLPVNSFSKLAEDSMSTNLASHTDSRLPIINPKEPIVHLSSTNEHEATTENMLSSNEFAQSQSNPGLNQIMAENATAQVPHEFVSNRSMHMGDVDMYASSINNQAMAPSFERFNEIHARSGDNAMIDWKANDIQLNRNSTSQQSEVNLSKLADVANWCEKET